MATQRSLGTSMSLYIIISSGMEAFDWSMENSRFPPFELNLILYLFLVPWKSPAFIHQSPKPETWEWFLNMTFLHHHICIPTALPVLAFGLQERKKESEVAQLGPTLCDHMDCSLPGSSVHGNFQARTLKWVAISFSSRSSQPRN